MKYTQESNILGRPIVLTVDYESKVIEVDVEKLSASELYMTLKDLVIEHRYEYPNTWGFDSEILFDNAAVDYFKDTSHGILLLVFQREWNINKIRNKIDCGKIITRGEEL